MNNKTAILVGLSVFALIAIVLALNLRSIVPWMSSLDPGTPTPAPTATYSNEDGPFKLQVTYLGNSRWDYTVAAQLPNPCYGATVDVSVAESYPEQVTIWVTPTYPKPDQMCVEMISDFSATGAFSASAEAKISLKVVQD